MTFSFFFSKVELGQASKLKGNRVVDATGGAQEMQVQPFKVENLFTFLFLLTLVVLLVLPSRL